MNSGNDSNQIIETEIWITTRRRLHEQHNKGGAINCHKGMLVRSGEGTNEESNLIISIGNG